MSVTGTTVTMKMSEKDCRLEILQKEFRHTEVHNKNTYKGWRRMIFGK
jgi:hypothetical protein